MRLKHLFTDKALKLFEKYEVLSHKELHSRYDIYVETYAKQINIEGLTAIDMAKKQFIPAAIEYATFLADSISQFKSVKVEAIVQEDLLKKLGAVLKSAYNNLGKLETAIAKAQSIDRYREESRSLSGQGSNSHVGVEDGYRCYGNDCAEGYVAGADVYGVALQTVTIIVIYKGRSI